MFYFCKCYNGQHSNIIKSLTKEKRKKKTDVDLILFPQKLYTSENDGIMMFTKFWGRKHGTQDYLANIPFRAPNRQGISVNRVPAPRGLRKSKAK